VETESDEPRPVRPAPQSPPPAWKSRRSWAIGVALVVVVSTLIGFAFAIRSERSRARRSVPVRVDSLAVIDPGLGRVVGDLPLGATPESLVAGFGRLWIGDQGHRMTVVEAGNRRRASIGLPVDPQYLASGAGGVWVFDGLARLLKIDPGSPQVHRSRRLWSCRLAGESGALPACGGGGVVIAGGRVWVGEAPDAAYAAPHGILVQLDPGDLRQVGRIPGVTIGQLGAGIGGVWSIGAAGGLEMDRVDPATGRVERQALGSANRATNIVSAFGFIWTGSSRRLYRFAPRGGYVSFRLPAAATAIAAAPDGIWVATDRGRILRLNPSSGLVEKTVPVGGRSPVAVAYAGGRVWVAVGS
jgi:PAS domain-containing protein